MKISYQWLKSFLSITKTPEEIAECLTQTGLEVTHLTPFRLFPEGLVIGEVISWVPHPEADKLKKTSVDIGGEAPLSIVCGAPNVATGQKVIVAPVGSILSLPSGETLKIKKRKIRGILSEGMICAADEIGLGKKHEEILVLETKRRAGTLVDDYWSTPEDVIFEIDLTPNRNDAISHLGVARDIAVFFGKTLKMPSDKPLVPEDSLPLQIVIRDKKKCIRYTGVVIENVAIKPSPISIQNYLRAIGLSPINNVVDIANFIMHDIGQPIHVFDYDLIAKNKIVVQTLPAGTSFTTLDGVERTLSGEELMICDEEGPLCMAGILGGERGKVTEATKNIFIESACFDPVSIAKTARYHQIQTDASFRYERGTDPEIPYVALQKICDLLVKYVKGTIASMPEDHYPHKTPHALIDITHAYIEGIIGMKLPVDTIHLILKRLDIQVQDVTEEGFTAIVPPYRRDVTRPIDLVEEILRIYGYNRIALPKDANVCLFPVTTDTNEDYSIQDSLAKVLAMKGFYEIRTNAITNSAYIEEEGDMASKESVLLANPLSNVLDAMRQTLLFAGLEVIRYHINRQESSLLFFEMGKVYRYVKDTFQEEEKLGIWIVGNRGKQHWSRKWDKFSFSDLHEIVTYLLMYYQIEGVKVRQVAHGVYGECCLMLEDEKRCYGYIGMVKRRILDKMDIKEQVFFGEIDLALFLKEKKRLPYQAISKFPFVTRDLSLAIARDIKFATIRKVIEEQKVDYLQHFHVIDVYEDDSIGAGKKAYTIRFTLQSVKKTLKEKDINRSIKLVSGVLEEKTGATIRD